MSECLMFGMDCDARSMASVVADEENVSFLVGTNNINGDNHVNRLFVDAEGSRLMSKSFRHPIGEVRSICSHPTKMNILATATANYTKPGGEYTISVWNIDDDKRTLETAANKSCEKKINCLEWETNSNRSVAVSEASVEIYDMRDEPRIEQKVKILEDGEIFSGLWSPHYEGNMLGLTVGKSAVCVDTRTNSDHLKITHAHSHRTIGMDFNPNLQHVIATCGNDGYIRIWDTRNPNEAVMSMHPHAHWIWQVKYHPVHDQLLLSVGSDGCVVLSCAQSVSSEQQERFEDEEEEDNAIEKIEDGQLERIDEHEDSVYCCAWSAADPWSFASLSYDGRLILSKVSRKHKYALMQL